MLQNEVPTETTTELICLHLLGSICSCVVRCPKSYGKNFHRMQATWAQAIQPLRVIDRKLLWIVRIFTYSNTMSFSLCVSVFQEHPTGFIDFGQSGTDFQLASIGTLDAECLEIKSTIEYSLFTYVRFFGSVFGISTGHWMLVRFAI